MPISGQKRLFDSVFWKVAVVLITVQLATGILAVGFTAWYARDQQLSLASVALTARLDAVSEEIERRSASNEVFFSNFSEDLILDLGYRFPDPLFIIDLGGNVNEMIYPSLDAFPEGFIDSTVVPVVPDILDLENTFVQIIVDATDTIVPGGFASAPLLDTGGFPVGIIVVQPITQSLGLELADTNEAFKRSIRVVAGLSIFIALLLGAFFTWWLVQPLKKIAATVSRIGEGDYGLRLLVKGHDEFASLSGAINQMTEKVQGSIDALKESDRIRRELVANVGHDLRTPLAAVEAHLEEAGRFRTENRSADAEESVESARRQSRVLGGLINDLFELSRLESTVPRLQLEQVLIAEIISDAVSSNSSAAKAKGIVVQSSIEDSMPIIRADGVRLLRLLTNLVSNAVRYSYQDGHIEILARRADDVVKISVSNDGEGIAPSDIDRLFDRYYRGSHARTRSGGEESQGTGLGLAISKAIAEAHGGSLQVESHVESGTVFVVTLPVVVGESENPRTK